MNEIKNYDVYNQRMSKTLYDKCWWIDKIDDEVNIVIDYGCGDCSLFDMINQICPGRFIYIGIDNDENMIKLAQERHQITPYKNIEELLEDNWQDYSNRIVLVMNSVMHEINTYLNAQEQVNLFAKIDELAPKYIAVRDMHLMNSDGDFCAWQESDFIWRDIINSKFSDRFIDYLRSKSGRRHCDMLNLLSEFFLKYTYIENWDREKDEIYLWRWLYDFNKYYDIVFENDFYIPYIAERIQNDFGINWQKNTHKKVLYKLS